MTYLSIIIPAYNEEKRIPIIVESLKKQTFQDFETIVAISPKTSDRTREVAKSLGCKLTEGGRPDKGRNNGADASNPHSRYFCFIDADASLDSPSFLEKAIEEINARQLDVAGTLQKPIWEGDILMHLAHIMIYGIANYSMLKRQYTEKPLMQNCMFSRKKTHYDIGGFKPLEFGEDSRYAQDAVAKGYKFGILTSTGMIYISPRRFVKEGLGSVISKNLRFIRRRERGEEVYQSEREKKGKYWTD
ncbi:MAG: glycosyltransferase [Candidatus Pacearchaeota archaeon]